MKIKKELIIPIITLIRRALRLVRDLSISWFNI